MKRHRRAGQPTILPRTCGIHGGVYGALSLRSLSHIVVLAVAVVVVVVDARNDT